MAVTRKWVATCWRTLLLLRLSFVTPTHSIDFWFYRYPIICKLVESSTAGKQYEMQVGDEIVSVNGMAMLGQTPSEVHKIVKTATPGELLEFVIKPVGPRTRMAEAMAAEHTQMATGFEDDGDNITSLTGAR
jgi:hypothetical protein